MYIYIYVYIYVYIYMYIYSVCITGYALLIVKVLLGLFAFYI